MRNISGNEKEPDRIKGGNSDDEQWKKERARENRLDNREEKVRENSNEQAGLVLR